MLNIFLIQIITLQSAFILVHASNGGSKIPEWFYQCFTKKKQSQQALAPISLPSSGVCTDIKCLTDHVNPSGSNFTHSTCLDQFCIASSGSDQNADEESENLIQPPVGYKPSFLSRSVNFGGNILPLKREALNNSSDSEHTPTTGVGRPTKRIISSKFIQGHRRLMKIRSQSMSDKIENSVSSKDCRLEINKLVSTGSKIIRSSGHPNDHPTESMETHVMLGDTRNINRILGSMDAISIPRNARDRRKKVETLARRDTSGGGVRRSTPLIIDLINPHEIMEDNMNSDRFRIPYYICKKMSESLTAKIVLGTLFNVFIHTCRRSSFDSLTVKEVVSMTLLATLAFVMVPKFCQIIRQASTISIFKVNESQLAVVAWMIDLGLDQGSCTIMDTINEGIDRVNHFKWHLKQIRNYIQGLSANMKKVFAVDVVDFTVQCVMLIIFYSRVAVTTIALNIAEERIIDLTMTKKICLVLFPPLVYCLIVSAWQRFKCPLLYTMFSCGLSIWLFNIMMNHTYEFKSRN